MVSQLQLSYRWFARAQKGEERGRKRERGNSGRPDGKFGFASMSHAKLTRNSPLPICSATDVMTNTVKQNTMITVGRIFSFEK